MLERQIQQQWEMVSIPYSTIKILQAMYGVLNSAAVSIPYSTIKITMTFISFLLVCWFQFLIVRLKSLYSLFI